MIMTLEPSAVPTASSPAADHGSSLDDLQRYARTGDTDAFGKVVRRHINIVYSFCRRQLNDPAVADDATQAVFILLAKKASTIRDPAKLTPWLFEAARYCCANARRAAARRAKHEREAAKQRSEIRSTDDPMNNLHLDDDALNAELHQGLVTMRDKDRQVLLLRYFEQRSHREVGQLLGVSEEAAKHRVVRAVDKLRAILTRRGAVGATAMTMLPQWLETCAVLPAPASLAARLAGTGAAGLGTAGTAAASIAKAAGSAMLWTKLALVGVVIAAGAGVTAVAVLANGSDNNNATTAPATVPATAVAKTQRELFVEWIRQGAADIRGGNEEGALRGVLLPPGPLGEAYRTGMRTDVRQEQIVAAIREAFGDDAPVFRYTNMTAADVLTAIADQPDRIEIDGDHARAPFLTGHFHFVRVPGTNEWKFDIVKSVKHDLVDEQGRMRPADPETLEKTFRAIVLAADDVLTDLEVGAISDPSQVQASYERHLSRHRQELKVFAVNGNLR